MKRGSGKFVLRLPPDLHEALQRQSAAKGVSLNELCKNKLAELLVPTAPAGSSYASLVASIRRLPFDLEAIVLFGSTARGEAESSSDVDLLLVLPSHVAPTRSMYALWDDRFVGPFAPRENLKLTPHFVALPQSIESSGSLWFEVSLDGNLLWEKNNATSAWLAKLRAEIAAGRVHRRFSHGQPYWVRGTDEE